MIEKQLTDEQKPSRLFHCWLLAKFIGYELRLHFLKEQVSFILSGIFSIGVA